MGDIAKEKERLRQECALARARLKNREKDEKIAERFFASPFFAYRSFFVYRSVRTEADTAQIIAGLYAAGKTVCLPCVEGEFMRSVRALQGDKLEKGAFGIYQPQCGEEENCEVAIVPLLAADGQGNRLGYGGGYYDKYFSAHPHVLRVGICYAGQVIPAIPTETTDMRLHYLITERGVLSFGR